MDTIDSNWIEFDLNPIIVFDNNSRVLSHNTEASYLLSQVDKNDIYNLALLHAPSTFGLETKFETIKLKRFQFIAISVSYFDEEKIGVKLYKLIEAKRPVSKLSNFSEKQIVNIYTLIDLAISTNSITAKEIKHLKEFDPTIPSLKIDTKKFVNIVDSVYKSMHNSTSIKSHLGILTGEYIILDDKKYQTIELTVTSDKPIIKELITRDLSSNIFTDINDNGVSVIFPLITE